MNAYVREELKFESDRVCEFLNTEVNRSWDWSSGLSWKQGFLDVSLEMRDALAVNEHLTVLIAGGLFDLATPYFAAHYTLSHMWLGERRSNVTLKRYHAGHMIYTHRQARENLFRDVERFYGKTPCR